jgi:formylglycine-generating enzyme required for sulfatase activity/class 3 adenylate cyclase
MGSDNIGSHERGTPRRLAVILSADIKDYSHLMGIDEEGTLARMKRYRREVIDPTIAEHEGRVIKNTGDGLLAVFDSPLEAVRCAIVIQQSLVGRNAALPKQQWLQYRIGVNLGDVIIDPDDIYGDGVNIAARVQALAPPGTVYISGGVYEQVKNKLVCGYQSLGDKRVKNITDPVRIYRVLPDPDAVASAKRRNRIRAGIAAAVFLMAGAGGWYAMRPNVPTQAEEPPAVRAASQPRSDQHAAAQITPPETSRSPARSAPSQAEPVPQPSAPMPPRVTAEPQPVPQTPPPVTAAPQPSPQAPPAIAAAPQPSQTPSQLAASPQSIPQTPTPAAETPGPLPQVAVISPPRLPPVSGPYEAFVDCERCPAMISLPAGTFAMGSNDDPTEKPIHQVNVPPLAIGRIPVTIGEWKHCVAAKACAYEPSGSNDLPVHNVSWNDAQQYVRWLSDVTGKKYRLPTEAEWEYAARAGSSTRYWWGNQVLPGMANCKDCGDGSDPRAPMKVASFSPNPFGLYDMTGAVAQWVSDCWHKDYQGAPKDGSSWEAPNCRERVLRGGSWMNDASTSRPANRNRYDPGVRYPAHGLRVVRSRSD